MFSSVFMVYIVFLYMETYSRIQKSGYRSGSSGRIKNLDPICASRYIGELIAANRVEIRQAV